ncbi:MAG: nucleotide exchange factor GrpE [Thermodesulfatator sp.]|nr:MAG: nucleotide exchange factor GrpE [Thermodesulfatator sp.]
MEGNEKSKEIKEKEGIDNMDKNENTGNQSPETESLEEQLQEKEEELKKCEDRVLRLAAELENFKKRVEREKLEHMKYALEEFAKELLPFLDNLERALDSARETKDLDKLVEGIDLTLSGYFKTLEKFGLKTFAAEGHRFDPNYHEALTVEETEDAEDNTVLKELLKGYTLHERVLRPALVVVAKKNKKDSGQTQ